MPTLDEAGIKDQEAETMTGGVCAGGHAAEIVDLLQRNRHGGQSPEIKGRLWSSASCRWPIRRSVRGLC